MTEINGLYLNNAELLEYYKNNSLVHCGLCKHWKKERNFCSLHHWDIGEIGACQGFEKKKIEGKEKENAHNLAYVPRMEKCLSCGKKFDENDMYEDGTLCPTCYHQHSEDMTSRMMMGEE